MILLALQEIRKSVGTHEVLKGVSFTLQDQERMGLVGVNGSGKSTLMKIIAGQETADSGTVSLQKGLRIGYLAQQGELTGEETVLRVLESVFDPVVRLEEELRETEQRMAECVGDPEALRRLGSRYDALTHAFEEGGVGSATLHDIHNGTRAGEGGEGLQLESVAFCEGDGAQGVGIKVWTEK